MHLAVARDDVKLVRTLLAAAADPNVARRSGEAGDVHETPLHLAVRQQFKDCIIYLLNSADIDVSIKMVLVLELF